MEKTNNELICPICLETFESPKVLTCLHTFCEKCICKHVRGIRAEGTHSETVACPVCRSNIVATAIDQTPDDWAAKLPTNSTVLALLTSEWPRRYEPIYCEPCSKDGKHHTSVAYCVTCTEYLCHTCYNCHKNFKMTNDHTFTVNTLPENPNANEADDGLYWCSSHNRRFTYFCADHKELCCYKCAINVHRSCVELASVEDLAKDIKEREDPKQISDNLEAVKELFQILLESRSKCLKSVENKKTEITMSLKKWRNAMNDHISKVEADALQKLDQVCKQESIIVSDHIAEIKSSIAAIDTSHRMLNEGIRSADETKVFMTIKEISKHVQKYLQRCDVIEQDSEEVQIEFRYDKRPEDFIEKWRSVGEVRMKKSKLPKLSSSSSFESSHFSVKVSGDIAVCNIYSGVFLPDDKLVLSDYNNKKIKLFDRKSNFLDQFSMQNAPYHICRVDHRTVAVSAYKSVILFYVSHTLTPLRTIDTDKICFGIASCQETIIVHQFDGTKDLLVTFDTSYKIINTIELSKQNTWNTHCISPDGQRICYPSQNKIVAINKKGQQLNIFESNDLEAASGITVDKKGNIYCCGYKSNTVVQVFPEGRQLAVLLSQNCGLKQPVGLCLNDKSNTVLVFEEKSDYVRVFRLK